MDLVGKVLNGKYRIIKSVGEGGMSRVWLAEDPAGEGPVVVKVLKPDATSNRIEDVIRFKNEATTASSLNIPAVARVYEIGEYGNLHYIVMENCKGSSLQHYLEAGMTFSSDESVAIIREIAAALKQVHAAGVIHRDLKPGNIMIDLESEPPQIKLIDFGLAQVKEFVSDVSENDFTLSYMSPEQIVAFKRNIDERSDLYSLGIIFYQLVTEELPYRGDSFNSIIHQHIAKMPEIPTKLKPNLPKVLEEMVLKMIEKEPEQRYQSAEGLLSDLDKYLKGQRNFLLGLEDRGVKLNYRTRLVAREQELTALKEAYNNAAAGQGGICLIAGEDGLGKSRLIEEFSAYVDQRLGIYIKGKCFSGRNKIPYGPIKEALNVYARHYQKLTASRQKYIRESIKEGIGDLGQIIINLNPLLEEIIGESQPLVELEPDRENRRFLMVVSQFIFALGVIEGVLVIEVDDLQWVDEGTLDLLRDMMAEISRKPVLVIGSYRDNELGEEKVLQEFINATSEGSPLICMNLKPFDRNQTNKFIAGLLFDSEEHTHAITNIIWQKSQGNPYFAVELLKQLVDEKALVRREQSWKLDPAVLCKIELSNSIVDTLMKRITTLSPNENRILSAASAIGRKFDMEMLFAISPFAQEEIVAAVDKAISMHIIDYDPDAKGRLVFAHERIKEVFYTSLDKVNRRALHKMIAESLENSSEPDKDEKIFDLAYHYTEAGDTAKAEQYAYPAGKKACENYAYDQAIKYLSLAVMLMEERDEKGSDKWIECMEYIGAVYSTIGKNDEAIELFNTILPSLKTTKQKANAYRNISHSYYNKGHWLDSERYGKLGLALLGERIPEGKLAVVAGIIWQVIVRAAQSLVPWLYNRVKTGTRSEEAKEIVSFYFILLWAYALSGVLEFAYGTYRLVNLSRSRTGLSKETALSISGYANMLGAIAMFGSAEKYHKQALELKEILKDEWGMAQSYQWMGYMREWAGEYEKAMEYFDKALEMFKRMGDMKEYNMTLNGLVHCCYYLGDYEKMKDFNSRHLESAVRTTDNYAITAANIYNVQYFREKDHFGKAELCGLDSFNRSFEAEDWFNYCSANIELAILFMDRDDFKKAIEYLERARDLYQTNTFLQQYTVLLFYSLAEAYIADYKANIMSQTPAEKKSYLKKIEKISKKAMAKTKGWNTHLGGALRALAKYQVLAGSNHLAEKYFLQSISHCTKHKRKFELARGLYDYGLFLAEVGR
ncbi:MAG: protein kinase domain-containing protein, partial [Candidatus Saccharibacteria bacterium]